MRMVRSGMMEDELLHEQKEREAREQERALKKQEVANVASALGERKELNPTSRRFGEAVAEHKIKLKREESRTPRRAEKYATSPSRATFTIDTEGREK